MCTTAQITQAGNPDLTDKTSREGLIDKGYATSDFVFLLQLVLAWIRRKPYSQYRLKQATANEEAEGARAGGYSDKRASQRSVCRGELTIPWR